MRTCSGPSVAGLSVDHSVLSRKPPGWRIWSTLGISPGPRTWSTTKCFLPSPGRHRSRFVHRCGETAGVTRRLNVSYERSYTRAACATAYQCGLYPLFGARRTSSSPKHGSRSSSMAATGTVALSTTVQQPGIRSSGERRSLRTSNGTRTPTRPLSRTAGPSFAAGSTRTQSP